MSNKICVADCSHHFRSSLLVHNEFRPPSTSGQTRLRKQERVRIKMAALTFLALSTLGELARLAAAQPSQNIDSLVILYSDIRTRCLSIFTDHVIPEAATRTRTSTTSSMAGQPGQTTRECMATSARYTATRRLASAAVQSLQRSQILQHRFWCRTRLVSLSCRGL